MDGTTIPARAPFPCFADVAERLADNGYSPLPVKPGSKRVVETGWTRYCLEPIDGPTLDRWVSRHSDWGTGLATGRLVGIDIDILDQDGAFKAERRARAIFGDTPLVRIGKAPKRLLFYRASEPFNTLKADPLEVLAIGRQAVAFAVHPETGNPYVWADESPLDVPFEALPAVTERQAHEWIGNTSSTVPVLAKPQSAPHGLVLAEKGFRHDTLFSLVRKAGLTVATEAALIQEALALNAAICTPPLPDCLVLAMARGVWRYRERGTLWADDGGARAILSVWEFDALSDAPEAIALLILLKLCHGSRKEDFAIVPDSMAEAGLLGDWGKKSYMRARDLLLERGFIERTHEGGGRGNPHLYRLTTGKGSLWDQNIKQILPQPLTAGVVAFRRRSFVQVRYHLDGTKTVTAGREDLTLFDLSAIPLHPVESLRQGVRAQLAASPRGSHGRLAALIGVSEPQLSNFLSGRRRLNGPSESMLGEFIRRPGGMGVQPQEGGAHV